MVKNFRKVFDFRSYSVHVYTHNIFSTNNMQILDVNTATVKKERKGKKPVWMQVIKPADLEVFFCHSHTLMQPHTSPLN